MEATDSAFYVAMMASINENLRTYNELGDKAEAEGNTEAYETYKQKYLTLKEQQAFILAQWKAFSKQ